MRILVASDIHGSSLFCGKLLDAFRREKAEKLLLDVIDELCGAQL